MSYFHYQNHTLCVEDVPLSHLAQQYGTPLYVYSGNALTDNFQQYARACAQYENPKTPSLICYSVKSCSNIAILNLLAKQGAGFDIVSGGELQRVIAAGGNPEKVVFSGVGKTVAEIRLALQHNILCFNVESEAELLRINEIAGQMGVQARIAYRINPNIDAKTHPYISTGLRENKFGIPYENALTAYQTAANLPHIAITGIDCHIGSQLLDDAPLLEAVDRLILLCDQLQAQGIAIHHIDIGGGIGIRYKDETPVPIKDYLSRLFQKIGRWRDTAYQGAPIRMMFEPGRSISGTAGVLLTEVQYLKENSGRNFAIVDAAMNDLMRPAMYESWHDVMPVTQQAASSQAYDLVGPVCESGDWLAKQRHLTIRQGDLLALMCAGAYSMAMASNYNTRARAAEVLVLGDQIHLIRERETASALFALEKMIP